jgi:hypothetical protein
MGRVQFQHDFGIFTTLIMGDIGQTHGTWTCRSGGGRPIPIRAHDSYGQWLVVGIAVCTRRLDVFKEASSMK